jgi:FtsH-binding integral membrane protein
MVVMAGGIGGALLVAWSASKRTNKNSSARLREFLPWALILLLIGLLAVRVFLLPMEMRGSVLG